MTTPTTVEELLDYWPGNIPFKGSLVSDDGSCMCAQGQALHFLDGMSADDLSNLEQKEADKRVAELFGISRAHAVLLRRVNDTEDGAPSVVIRNPEKVIGDQAHIVLAFWRHLDRMSPDDWITLDSARAKAGDSARDSARASAWARAGASAEASARASAEASAWDSAWDGAWASAWDRAGASVRDSARDGAWDGTEASAGASAGASAWDSAWDSARDSARASAWDSARDSAWASAEAGAWATNEIQGAAVMRAKNLPFFFLPLFGFSDPEAVLTANIK